MDIAALIGRVVFSFMFVMSGMVHISKRTYMSEYARSMGVPAASALVVASGAQILAGGLMVALGIWGDIGALLIAAFLVPTAMMMHPYWKVPDPQMRAMQQAHFMKNMSLTGGALLAFSWFLCSGGGTYSVTTPLFWGVIR